MAKFTAEEKLQTVLRYMKGKESFKTIAQSLGADEKNIRVWKKQYEHNGVETFIKRYTNYTLHNWKVGFFFFPISSSQQKWGLA